MASTKSVTYAGWGTEVLNAPWDERGVTGKAIARVDLPSGPHCLRRYPRGTDLSWLLAIHELVETVAGRGFTLFPRFVANAHGSTVVAIDRHLHDLSTWAAGAPCPADALDTAQLRALGAAVGSLHSCGHGIAPPPRFFDLDRPPVWNPQHWAYDGSIPDLLRFYEDAVLGDEVLAPLMGKEVQLAARALEGGLAVPDDAQTLTHGDLWVDHVHWDGDDIVAILDVDLLDLRPGWTDVVALLADFALWAPDRCAAVLAGYRRHAEVRVEILAVLPLVWTARTLGVLRQRIEAWRDDGTYGGEPALGGPVPYWVGQLRRMGEMDWEPGALA